MSDQPEQPAQDFEKLAQDNRNVGIVREFLAFLGENKKWWLIPLLVILVLMGALILLSGSAAAPFIYTLF